MAPGSLLYYICLCDLFLFAFIFRSIKPKIQKYLDAIYFISRSRDIFLSNYYNFLTSVCQFLAPLPRGIDNPFNTSGCEYLLFVRKCRSHSVAWFSYWFDNLGLNTEGNTYHCCAASSFPLWGNTDIVLADIKRNFWRHCRGDIINIYQVPNHKYHLLAIYIICHLPLVFLSPTSQTFVVLSAPFLFAVLLSNLMFACVAMCLLFSCIFAC